MEDLAYKGREANHDLSFRRWSQSKHAQYFTPLEVANAIYTGLKRKITEIEKIWVLDPAAGSGRLLIPWKRAGAHVVGIELDEETGKVLKHNIGSKNLRIGDILKYAPYFGNNGFDLVITNPPFGITWNTEGVDFCFETAHYGGRIESQSATMEIAIASLAYGGILVAIIPTKTFSNEKDRKLVRFINAETELLGRFTVDHMFKQEYGIDVQVDVIIARKGGYSEPDQSKEPIVAQISDVKEIAYHLDQIELEVLDGYHGNEEISIPDLSNLISYPIGNSLELNISGAGGDPFAISLVDFYDETIETYNGVLGCRTGVKEAYLSPPALMTGGPERAVSFFRRIGFETHISDTLQARLQRLQRKYAFLTLPFFPPKSHQLLAYFTDRPYKAIKTVKNADDKILFIEGKEYAVHPCWIRNMQTVKVEYVQDSKGNPVKKTTSLDRGYLSIEVNGEQGPMRFDEPETENMKTFIEAFGLPEVKTLDDVVPNRIRQYHRQIERAVPQLFDYQLYDLARLCCKPFGYIGYDMGGGKTLTALAYCIGRGTKWNLIVCQASLVDVWVNEGRKFGIEVQRLTTHASVDEFLAKRKRWVGVEKKTLPIQFYVISYEFLSLDTARVYDPWKCVMTDKDGSIIHSEISTGKSCSKGHSRKEMVKACPKCNEFKKWTSNYCHACGYRAYEYKEPRQYPAYKRLSKCFSTIIVDEAQMAKNVSGRGLAVRATKSRCKLLLSGTIQRGFISDVYHNFGWLLGHSNPLFPYAQKGGSAKFLNEFGTFEYVSKEFEDTLTTGRRKIIPEVSNLNRFWRILSAFTVRRLKDEMVILPPKNKNIVLLDMEEDHRGLYEEFANWAKHTIDRELRKPGLLVNMGVISDCLWALRFAATAPNDYTHLQGRGPGKALEHREYNKVKTIIDMVKKVKENSEKVVIFSGLRSMVDNIDRELGRHQISAMKITSSMNCLKRFGAIEEFQNNGYTALVAGLNVLNRGYTITKANHVIITDLEYQPESTEQAEDRVHRTGQEKPVTVTYLLSKDTIDELMLEVITQKREAISHSINGTAKYASTAELLKQMDNRNVELMIAKKVLESRRTFFPTKPTLIQIENVKKPTVQVSALPDNTDWVNVKQLSLFD
jgi:hypothetical protein